MFTFLPFLMKVWMELNYSQDPITPSCNLISLLVIFVHLLQELNMYLMSDKTVFLLRNFKCSKYHPISISYQFCERD